MAKAKSKSKESRRVPNRHLHSRISFLHQAAQYLANRSAARPQASKIEERPTENSTKATESDDTPQATVNAEAVPGEKSDDQASTSVAAVSGQALRLSSHLLAVSQRSKVLVSQDVKRSICKRCNELLVPGKTATHRLENKSTQGKKPWADVLVVACERCGFQKRYPVGQQRQAKKKDRVRS